MIRIPAFFGDKKLDKRVSEYINCVLEEIVSSEISLMNDYKTMFPDETPYLLSETFPPAMLRDNPSLCVKRVYELKDLLSSPVERTQISPIYRLILFSCIESFLESMSDDECDGVLPLDKETEQQIITEFGPDAIHCVTDIESYLNSLFEDWDFLPEQLNLITDLSMSNPKGFRTMMSYEELDEYIELMDVDLRDAYLRFRKQFKQPPCNSEQQLQQSIFKALLLIQNNRIYYGRTENEINDAIRDNLSMIFEVKDQTRRGESKSGKSAGELDFLIYEKGNPIAIVEALKLSRLNRQCLSTHIEKLLYSYDPTGYPNAFLLLYVTAKDFNRFWMNCASFISAFECRFPVKEPLREIILPYAESRSAIIVLERNGIPVSLHFFAIHLRS